MVNNSILPNAQLPRVREHLVAEKVLVQQKQRNSAAHDRRPVMFDSKTCAAGLSSSSAVTRRTYCNGRLQEFKVRRDLAGGCSPPLLRALALHLISFHLRSHCEDDPKMVAMGR